MDPKARPFRFGVVVTGEAESGEAWSQYARRVESQGFSTLLVADHYANPMACTPLMLAAAVATTTLRVGSFVLNNDFRHPAMLAKEVATIDVLSGGRVELALGAGWLKEEYDQVGLPFDSGSVRAERFEEAVGLIKQMLAGQTVHHQGPHYRLEGYQARPVPVQQPVPLLIGGGGPRMLGLAAREADIVGFVPGSLPGGGLDPQGFGASVFDHRVSRFDAAVAACGRSHSPERNILLSTVAPSASEADKEWIPEDLLASSPFALLGSPGEMVDRLHEHRARWGLSYFVCFAEHAEHLVPVIDELRTASSR